MNVTTTRCGLGFVWYLVWSCKPNARMTKSEYARTIEDLAHFVLKDATVMGAAAPKIAIAALLKQILEVPYFC